MKTIRFFLVAFALVSAFSLGAQDLKQGIRLLDVEKFNDAQSFFAQRIAAEPTNMYNYYFAGEAAFRAGDVKKAQEYFKKGLPFDVNGILFVAAEGACLGEQGDEGRAKNHFTMAIIKISEVKDIDLLIYSARAMMLGEVKGIDGAMTLLNRAIALDKKSVNFDARYELGNVLLEKGDGGQAVSMFEKAAEMDKTSAKPYWRLGFLYTRARNLKEALPNFEKAVAMDAGLAPVYRDMGDLYFQMGQTDKAIESYKKYLSMIDKSIESQVKYASFLITNKDYKGAYQESKEIEKTGTDNIYFHRILGYAACEVDSVKEGLKSMQDFMSKAPKEKIRLLDYQYLGRLQMKAGMDSLARQSFMKAIEMDTTVAVEIYSMQADYYMKARNYQQAVRSYDSLLVHKQGPKGNEYFSLGRAYYYMKDYVKADSAFAMVIAISPNYIPAYAFRGRCGQSFEKKPDEGKAKPHFEKVIELANASPDPNKYKRELIEAHKYLGYHYYLKNDKVNAKSNFETVLKFDPADKDALDVMKHLK